MTDTRIIVRHGEISEIAKIFGMSLPRVRRALRGNKTVVGYDRVRKCAMERGGVEVSEVKNNQAG